MEAKRIMNSRQMGKLMWARGFYGKSGGIDFEKEWRSSSAIAGGGILLDQGIHMIDLLNYFMGDFSEIKSYVDKIYWDIPLEDNAFALFNALISLCFKKFKNSCCLFSIRLNAFLGKP